MATLHLNLPDPEAIHTYCAPAWILKSSTFHLPNSPFKYSVSSTLFSGSVNGLLPLQLPRNIRAILDCAPSSFLSSDTYEFWNTCLASLLIFPIPTPGLVAIFSHLDDGSSFPPGFSHQSSQGSQSDQRLSWIEAHVTPLLKIHWGLPTSGENLISFKWHLRVKRGDKSIRYLDVP